MVKGKPEKPENIPRRNARTNNKLMRQASAVTTALPLLPRINKHSSRGNGHFKGKMEKRWVILKLPTFPCRVSCGRVLCMILENYLNYPLKQALNCLWVARCALLVYFVQYFLFYDCCFVSPRPFLWCSVALITQSQTVISFFRGGKGKVAGRGFIVALKLLRISIGEALIQAK